MTSPLGNHISVWRISSTFQLIRSNVTNRPGHFRRMLWPLLTMFTSSAVWSLCVLPVRLSRLSTEPLEAWDHVYSYLYPPYLALIRVYQIIIFLVFCILYYSAKKFNRSFKITCTLIPRRHKISLGTP